MIKGFAKVALTSEENRYETVFRGLDYFTQDIVRIIDSIDIDDHHKNYILIKPNCIVTDNNLAVTHVEAIRAVLDFLKPIWQGRIIIAEGSGIGNTMEAFKNFGYLDLKKLYPNLEYSDLNYSNAIFINIFDKDLKPLRIKIANTVQESPLRISVGPPKTHDSVIVTLSIKNMAVGSILKEDKMNIHQGPRAINRSLAILNEYTFPHLAVIDGWEAMEGNGPVSGNLVKTRFCVTSTNALAADVLTTELMGFNPVQIGYLNLLGAGKIKDRIEIVGKEPAGFARKFKPHASYLKQIQWQWNDQDFRHFTSSKKEKNN